MRGRKKKIKLFDIRKNDYPDERRDTFRSLQVFECWVCGSLTNKVVMGGYPGYGVRTVCPNSGACWHHEIENKMRWLNDHLHLQTYKAELQAEIDDIKKRNEKKQKHDLVGNPDRSLKLWVSNTFSTKSGGKCRHSLLDF